MLVQQSQLDIREELLARWHDRDQRGREPIHCGIDIDGKKQAYDADEAKSLE
jgi:hypothetical protein